MTINYSAWELRALRGVCRSKMSPGLRPRLERCVEVWVGWEVTIGVTIHDEMSDLRPNGVGDGHLRHDLWARFGKICRQESIDGVVSYLGC